jgi:hypothetical protein
MTTDSGWMPGAPMFPVPDPEPPPICGQEFRGPGGLLATCLAAMRKDGDGEYFCPACDGQAQLGQRRCWKCGCTDDRACLGGCYWVSDDLCSRCAGIV